MLRRLGGRRVSSRPPRRGPDAGAIERRRSSRCGRRLSAITVRQVVSGVPIRIVLGVALLTIGPPIVAQPLAAQRGSLEAVRAQALHTYYHGITAEIATQRIGVEGVPALLQLL